MDAFPEGRLRSGVDGFPEGRLRSAVRLKWALTEQLPLQINWGGLGQRRRQAAQQRRVNENGAVHLNGGGSRAEQGTGIFDTMDPAATDEGHIHQRAHLQQRMHGQRVQSRSVKSAGHDLA